MVSDGKLVVNLMGVPCIKTPCSLATFKILLLVLDRLMIDLGADRSLTYLEFVQLFGCSGLNVL